MCQRVIAYVAKCDTLSQQANVSFEMLTMGYETEPLWGQAVTHQFTSIRLQNKKSTRNYKILLSEDDNVDNVSSGFPQYVLLGLVEKHSVITISCIYICTCFFSTSVHDCFP